MGSAYNNSLFSWLVKINLFYQGNQSNCLGSYEESNRRESGSSGGNFFFQALHFQQLQERATCHTK